MDLNLFENLKKDIESNVTIKNFMEELSDFLKDMTSSLTQNKNNDITNENTTDTKEKLLENILDENNKKLKDYRKEGHLYLVTEDRNNEIYLWDFTDKSKREFKETGLPEELLSVAKEGSILQYKNGKYELYSENGYDMLFNEENNSNK